MNDYKKVDGITFHKDIHSKLEEGSKDYCKSFRCSCTKKNYKFTW